MIIEEQDTAISAVETTTCPGNAGGLSLVLDVVNLDIWLEAVQRCLGEEAEGEAGFPEAGFLGADFLSEEGFLVQGEEAEEEEECFSELWVF